MTIQRMPGSAITPGTITITQLESNVATVVSTGGGPKITNIQVTDNAYTVLDDTAVDITGGYITITGTGFVTGCSVIVGQLPAASVTFISSTEVRAQLSAQSAGTYIVYLVNPDGGVGIRVNGVTHSASPAWQTASSLGEQYDGVAINLSLVATDATSYTVTSGSLPPGLSLNSNTGVISGTVSGVANDTLYTFTVRATDAQLQDSPRTFTVTITVSDAYFKLTTLLLSGSAVSANTVVRDSSTNNFNLTVLGDARASNFTPYGTGWSAYFDGTGDYLTVPYNAAFSIPGDFTIEFWMYATNFPASIGTAAQSYARLFSFGTYNAANSFGLEVNSNDSGNLRKLLSWFNGTAYSLSGNNAVVPNIWYHIAVVRNGTTITCYLNGSITGTIASASATINTSQDFYIASLHAFTSDTSACFAGYLSNFRIIKGTALYTANFTPATTNLTSVANTSLLTCHVNRFMDGSTNNFAITRNGDARVVSFNPFNITNTGVNGSMYFDGTGDNVLVPTSANSIITGNSNFTLELWVFVTGAPGTYHGLFGGGSNDFTFSYSSQSSWGLYIAKVGLPPFIYTGMTVYNNLFQRWSHLAVTKNGTTWTIWVNGNSAVSVTDAVTFTNTQKAMGSQLGSDYMQGYISNVRYTAEVVYTNAFTPPTAPLTAITNTQLLTLQYDQPHNNHTFLDSSSNQFLITRSGNATQGTFSPFSPTGWSAYFDGTGDVLTIPDSAISQLGSSDFTVECWINTSKTTGGSILTKGVDENVTWGNFFFSLTSSGYLFFEIDPTPLTSADRFSLTDTVAINNGQWHHVAVTRSGNDWKLFRNGTIAASGTSSASFPDDTYAWVVGGSRVSGSTTATWVGYISNLRLIKGSAVYTTAFIPPTAPLTAITNTAFLICHTNRFIDASTNNFAITATGDSKVVAFSPFAPTAIYNPAVHGGSAYFDGTGDYLQSTISALPGQFTVEFWFYRSSTGNNFMFNIGDSINNAGAEVYIGTNGTVLNYYSNGNARITATPPNVGTWSYIAVSRDASNVVRLYLDGTQVGGTYTQAATLDTTLRVGAEYYNAAITGTATGYISGFRVSNTARTIAVPTQLLVNDASTVCLLNFTDAAILDSTGRQVLETLADAKSSSVVTKFTGGSMSFDGTGDYLQSSAALSDLVFLHNGTPWTVEGWFYTGSTSAQYILSTDAASASIGMSIGLSDTNTRDIMAQIFRGVSGSWLLAISPTNSWSLNTWTHFAATFDSSKNLTVYVNGVQVATASGSSFAFSSANPSYPLVVGRYQSPTPGGYFNGYISDLRVTRGYARYTGNFTAPTVPARLK